MYPFSDGDTHSTFGALLEAVVQEINALDNAEVLKASDAELEERFVAKATIRPLVLNADKYYQEGKSSVQIDVSNDRRRAIYSDEHAEVPGTRLEIAIPFEGDPHLWRVRASTFSLGGYPEIDVHDDRIVLAFEFPDDSPDPDGLKQEIDRQIASLSGAVANLQNDVEKHNSSAPNTVKTTIARKREKAKAASSAVDALGIPTKEEREGRR